MKTYVCRNCGHLIQIDNIDDYICPKCNSNSNYFDLIEENLNEIEMDAIIDSVIENAAETKNSKIININIEDKEVKITDDNNSIIRINDKCIKCGQCKKTCEKTVNISYDLNVCKRPICIGCGQCILTCPTNAIVPKNQSKEVKSIIDENKKIVVGVINPAVIEYFAQKEDSSLISIERKIIGALKKLGFDYIFNGSFGSDLYILEESSVLLSRLKAKERLPMFSSFCPAFIKYANIYYPYIVDSISTSKNPSNMMSSIIKKYFAENKGFDPSKIVVVSLSSCTSLKFDKNIDVDYVVNTSEIESLLEEDGININSIEEKDYDTLLSETSGSGSIVGITGGISEAIIRTMFKIITKNNIRKESLEFKNLRGFDGIKTAIIKIDKFNFKVAVVQQMENLEKMIKSEEYKKYHYIEVLNCKGGCIHGGGQILNDYSEEYLEKVINDIYNLDKKNSNRFSHDNKELKNLYKNYLKKPSGELSLELLHTNYLEIK